jgi:hypothetical protein
VKEDLVQGQHLDARPTGGVQGGEHVAGSVLGLTHPVADGGAIRGASLGQQQGEGLLDLVEAQPHGVQGNGCPPLLAPPQLDPVVTPPAFVAQLPLEVLDLAAKFLDLAQQLVAAGARLLGRGDGLLDLVGV